MRWLHFVGGITWIGLLYFFNLVNVPLQKKLDPDTKKKVNPDLLLPALWYFRWGAVLTVLSGLGYYAMYILKADVRLANATEKNVNGWIVLIVWCFIPVITFLVEFLIIKKVPALIKRPRLCHRRLDSGCRDVGDNFVVARLGTYRSRSAFCRQQDTFNRLWACVGNYHDAECLGHYLAHNKRMIGAMQGGPPAAPELARQAFVASRTNAWLSLPLLLFMGTSHGDWIIFGGR